MGWTDYFTQDSGGSGGGWGSFWGAMLDGVAAYADSEEQEDRDERGAGYARDLARTQGQENRRTAEYTAGLADFYRRRQQEERRRGMSNFGQFARQSWNQTYTPSPVGPVPTAMDYEMQSVAPPKTGGGLAGMARGG